MRQGTDRRLDIFERIIAPLPRLPLADLGAGHCKFAQIAHDAGFPVTAIDARRERVPVDVPFCFIEQDVREADLSRFDIVCILGLLYHLPLEDQLVLLQKCRGKTVIVDTLCAARSEVIIGMYSGRLVNEVLSDARSAWGNETSFWHEEPSLRWLFASKGFSAEKVPPEHAPNRSFWLLKPRALHSDLQDA